MQVQVTQFLRPDGRVQQATTELSDEPGLEDKYNLLAELGLRFTAEVLTTGEVSTCIEHELGDFDMSITPNGPEVQKGMIDMLRRFNENKFHSWKGSYL